ncbi:MAG: pirin family protein [Cyanobacteria bacterium P01_A01_bin.15]
MKTDLLHDRNHRGRTQLGWLNSYHTFSFGGFQDPNRMGFRALRVINEDRVVPGAGFPTHSHRDMEIFTYVLAGALEHKDSLGNGAVIRPGEAQIMSAGTGITHSEFNASTKDPVHFLQIWILPNQQQLPPRYEQHEFPLAERQGQLRLIAAQDGREGAVKVFQDVDLYTAVLEPAHQIHYDLAVNRFAWLQVARGIVLLNGEELREGDGLQLGGKRSLNISTSIGGEILLFDLA